MPEVASNEIKVSGGKLIKVGVSHDTEVREVEISGDFFLHPEEAIAAIEDSLVGLPLPLDADDTLRRVEEAIAAAGARLVGLSPSDIVRAISGAIG